MSSARHPLGPAGEQAAAAWYRAAGYEVLDTNWRRREGELDLVLRRGRTVVFCEVKTRSGDGFGHPAEAVTREKRHRLRLLAAKWLEEFATPVRDLRFDVAAVHWRRDGEPDIEIIEGAF